MLWVFESNIQPPGVLRSRKTKFPNKAIKKKGSMSLSNTHNIITLYNIYR